MKKLLFLVLAIIILVGCDTRTEEQRYQDYLKKKSEKEMAAIQQERWHGFKIKVVDSCEYIIRADRDGSGHRGYGFGFMAHKGNCRFCKERDSIKWEKRKKELEELVIKLKKK